MCVCEWQFYKPSDERSDKPLPLPDCSLQLHLTTECAARVCPSLRSVSSLFAWDCLYCCHLGPVSPAPRRRVSKPVCACLSFKLCLSAMPRQVCMCVFAVQRCMSLSCVLWLKLSECLCQVTGLTAILFTPIPISTSSQPDYCGACEREPETRRSWHPSHLTCPSLSVSLHARLRRAVRAQLNLAACCSLCRGCKSATKKNPKKSYTFGPRLSYAFQNNRHYKFHNADPKTCRKTHHNMYSDWKSLLDRVSLI